jgi:hypothetical protein
MHDEHEPTGTDVRFEDVAVLTPKIAGEIEDPLLRTPRAKAIGPTAGACTIRAPSRDAGQSIRAVRGGL